MEHMTAKGHVPLLIAKDGVKLAKHQICSFIAPSESPILEMDFLQLTGLQGTTKVVDAATINVALVFVKTHKFD